jgi:aspartate aminotransferase
MLYQIAEKVYELENAGRKVIKMNVGELDFKTPKEIIEAASAALKDGKTRYGSAAGEKALREKIAQMHGADPANVIITPGSKWAIFTTIDLLCRNKKIVSFSPLWPAFGSMARHFDAELEAIPLKMENNWDISFDEFSNAVKGKSLTILNNPTNPMSKGWSDAEQNKVMEISNDADVPVLLDLAYRDLAFTKKPDIEWKQGTIITNSFSKSLAMTGWRIGYIIAETELIERYKKLNQISITCVPKFIQAAALAGLGKREEITKQFRNECKARADAAMKVFGEKGVECTRPDAGFYVFPKLPCDDSFKPIMKLLEKYAIAMVPGSVFGNYPEHARISLCYSPDVIEDSLNKLMEVVETCR